MAVVVVEEVGVLSRRLSHRVAAEGSHVESHGRMILSLCAGWVRQASQRIARAQEESENDFSKNSIDTYRGKRIPLHFPLPPELVSQFHSSTFIHASRALLVRYKKTFFFCHFSFQRSHRMSPREDNARACACVDSGRPSSRLFSLHTKSRERGEETA